MLSKIRANFFLMKLIHIARYYAVIHISALSYWQFDIQYMV